MHARNQSQPLAHPRSSRSGLSGRTSGLSGRTDGRPERAALRISVDGDAAAGIESILIGAYVDGPTSRCAVVKATLPFRLRQLARTAQRASAGQLVVYAVTINGSIVTRLLTLLTLGYRVARAQRVLRRTGAARVYRYAVTPSLERPTIANEIGTPAAQYADRHLRPRGGNDRLRRLVARVAGVDPSIGAVVVAGLKA